MKAMRWFEFPQPPASNGTNSKYLLTLQYVFQILGIISPCAGERLSTDQNKHDSRDSALRVATHCFLIDLSSFSRQTTVLEGLKANCGPYASLLILGWIQVRARSISGKAPRLHQLGSRGSPRPTGLINLSFPNFRCSNPILVLSAPNRSFYYFGKFGETSSSHLAVMYIWCVQPRCRKAAAAPFCQVKMYDWS